MIKKLFLLFTLCFIALNTMAAVTIQAISIPDHDPFYSFKIHSDVSSNNYKVIEMPLCRGFERINEFLKGVTTTEHASLEFGYFDVFTQNTTWFPKTCHILLNEKNANKKISVVINKNSCSYRS